MPRIPSATMAASLAQYRSSRLERTPSCTALKSTLEEAVVNCWLSLSTVALSCASIDDVVAPQASGEDKRMPYGRAKVVIVGAGFGGIEAAKSLRRAPVEVTVI